MLVDISNVLRLWPRPTVWGKRAHFQGLRPFTVLHMELWNEAGRTPLKWKEGVGSQRQRRWDPECGSRLIKDYTPTLDREVSEPHRPECPAAKQRLMETSMCRWDWGNIADLWPLTSWSRSDWMGNMTHWELSWQASLFLWPPSLSFYNQFRNSALGTFLTPWCHLHAIRLPLCGSQDSVFTIETTSFRIKTVY